jgi:hypothetical protein
MIHARHQALYLIHDVTRPVLYPSLSVDWLSGNKLLRMILACNDSGIHHLGCCLDLVGSLRWYQWRCCKIKIRLRC